MRHIYVNELNEELDFVKKAIENFKKNKKHTSFGDVGEGNLFALRWGLGDDCVLVFKIGDEPRVYANVIKEEE